MSQQVPCLPALCIVHLCPSSFWLTHCSLMRDSTLVLMKKMLSNDLVDISGLWLHTEVMVEELEYCIVSNESSMCFVLARDSCISEDQAAQQLLIYLSFPLPPPQQRVSLCIYLFIPWMVCRVIALCFCDFLCFLWIFFFEFSSRGERENIMSMSFKS